MGISHLLQNWQCLLESQVLRRVMLCPVQLAQVSPTLTKISFIGNSPFVRFFTLPGWAMHVNVLNSLQL